MLCNGAQNVGVFRRMDWCTLGGCAFDKVAGVRWWRWNSLSFPRSTALPWGRPGASHDPRHFPENPHGASHDPVWLWSFRDPNTPPSVNHKVMGTPKIDCAFGLELPRSERASCCKLRGSGNTQGRLCVWPRASTIRMRLLL